MNLDIMIEEIRDLLITVKNDYFKTQKVEFQNDEVSVFFIFKTQLFF